MATALDPIIRTISNMMSRFGGTSTLTVTTSESSYDYDTSTSEEVVTDYPVQSIAFDYIQKKDGIGSGEGNTLIRSGDKQIFIKPYPSLPLPNPRTDNVTYKGTVYTIVTVKDYNPSGVQSVLYELFIRE